MKRWTLRISLCFLLGLVMTGTLACSALLVFGGHGGVPQIELPESNDVDWANRVTTSCFGVDVVEYWDGTVQYVDGWPRSRNSPAEFSHYTFDVYGDRRITVQAGWPMRAFVAEDSSIPIRHGFPGFDVHRSITTELHVGSGNTDEPPIKFALRFRPLWPGFLINTLFYAAIWFGLFFAAGRTRRFIRTRRGRCPRCGYDLQNNLADGCSECGWGRGE